MYLQNYIAFDFYRTLPFMKHWPIDRLINAGDNLIFHYFKRGKLIVADNTASDYLYIVKSVCINTQNSPHFSAGLLEGSQNLIVGQCGLVILLLCFRISPM